MNTKLSVAVLFLLMIAFACTQKKKGNTTFPPRYSTEPIVLDLEKGMEEISGLHFNSGDNSLYAICDDKGTLYKLSVTDGKILDKLKFYEGKDIEDLVMVGDSCYVLNSNGNILSFNYKDSVVREPIMHHIPEKGKNEFETLYRDKSPGKLELICKECDRDKKKENSSFLFDIGSGSYSDGSIALDVDQILSKSKEKEEKRFKPSAAAIHPVSGELYIISSVNKLLVVASPEGVLKEAYPLDVKLFKQPEGISFTTSGDMLISNESAGKGAATLLYYKYSP